MEKTLQNDRDKWKILMKNLFFFKPFNDSEHDSLLELCRVKKYNLHEYVIKESTQGNVFYVILKGTSQIIKKDGANARHEIAKLSAGDCFGEMAVLLEEPRFASVMAGSECYVFEIEGDQISKMVLETQVKLYREFAIMLAKRLKFSSMS